MELLRSTVSNPQDSGGLNGSRCQMGTGDKFSGQKTEMAVVVKTVLGSHFGVGAPPILVSHGHMVIWLSKVVGKKTKNVASPIGQWKHQLRGETDMLLL